ncbi:MAG: hypothetical protein ACREFQ_16345 [Stellaceae bacterium]
MIGACGVSLAARDGAQIDGAVLGIRPGYGPAAITPVPNLGAMDRWIWAPGLDQGWDPQGLAFARGELLVSAYRSRGFEVNRGPCRVFRIDPASGRTTGHVDVPKPCGHAGGLAYAADGTLYIADTHTLFAIDLNRAFAEPDPLFRILRLSRGLTGAFATSGQRRLWIGAYREAQPAQMFGFGLSALNTLPDGAILTTGMATARIPIPSYAQGAAFGADGTVWVARSEIAWGRLDRLDETGGRIGPGYPAPGGIEGIAFDPSGRLWGVSEAGARHIPLRYPFFPLTFRTDPARLRPGG